MNSKYFIFCVTLFTTNHCQQIPTRKFYNCRLFVLLKNKSASGLPKCLTDADCRINAFCYGNDHNKEGRCSCRRSFIPDPVTYDCLPVARKVGDPCRIEAQCSILLEGICNNGQCQCPPGFNFQGDKCGKAGVLKSAAPIINANLVFIWICFKLLLIQSLV
jgi:hypothetical protein